LSRYNVPLIQICEPGGTYASGEINHAQNQRSFPAKI
jgi:hypothetical protein